MKKVLFILSAVLIILLAVFGGKMLGKKANEKIDEELGKNSENTEVLEGEEAYKSGKISKDKYVSEFWNLRFEAEGNWIICTSDELKKENEAINELSITDEKDGIKLTVNKIEMLSQYPAFPNFSRCMLRSGELSPPLPEHLQSDLQFCKAF